jgi:predicted Fe-Mo cluster-binding NifX family protein
MIIAATYDNGEIFQHFGHTEQFKIYVIENNEIVSSKVVPTNGVGHGSLAGFLKELGVSALVCGGIGGGAKNIMAQSGIELYPGVSGDADQQIAALLAGKLAYDPSTSCSHHGEDHVCKH